MHFSGEECHGGKRAEDRITVLLAANQDGSYKIPVFVIGKSERPRCFKNYKVLLCDYKAQSNSWMTDEHVTNWVQNPNLQHLQDIVYAMSV